MLKDHFVQKDPASRTANKPTPQEVFDRRQALVRQHARWAELDAQGQCTCPACTVRRTRLG